MKDDPMGNGQLKAGYNVQAGTENQFIVDTTVHQRPGDTACAIPHCEHVKERIGRLPAALVADAGYGSEESYAYLEREGVDAYVKHSEFFRECRNRGWRDDEMRVANWTRDERSDEYTCPEGRALAFVGELSRVSDLGHESTVRVYECADCSGLLASIYFLPFRPTYFHQSRRHCFADRANADAPLPASPCPPSRRRRRATRLSGGRIARLSL